MTTPGASSISSSPLRKKDFTIRLEAQFEAGHLF
jgi:hypothetical protein